MFLNFTLESLYHLNPARPPASRPPRLTLVREPERRPPRRKRVDWIMLLSVLLLLSSCVACFRCLQTIGRVYRTNDPTMSATTLRAALIPESVQSGTPRLRQVLPSKK